MDDKETDSLPMDAEPIVDQPKLETPSDIPEPPVQGRERDEHGRFKPKEKGDTEEAPPASASEPENVPVKALQDERRKRQELEQRFADLQQQVEQKTAAPQPPPDIFEDPEGRLGVERQQTAQELYQQRFFMSQKLAELQHGKEAVVEAVNWAAEKVKQDPQFNMAALSQMDPVGFAIEQHRREQMASISPDDFAAFNAWRELQAKQPAEPAPAVQFPTSTVQDGSVASRGGPVWSGHTPDKDLLPMG